MLYEHAVDVWTVVSSVGAGVAAVIALAAWASSEFRATRERSLRSKDARAAAQQRALEDLLRALTAYASANPGDGDAMRWARWRIAAELALLPAGTVPALDSMRLDRESPPDRPRQFHGPTTQVVVFPLTEAIVEASRQLQNSREEHGVLTSP